MSPKTEDPAWWEKVSDPVLVADLRSILGAEDPRVPLLAGYIKGREMKAIDEFREKNSR